MHSAVYLNWASGHISLQPKGFMEGCGWGWEVFVFFHSGALSKLGNLNYHLNFKVFVKGFHILKGEDFFFLPFPSPFLPHLPVAFWRKPSVCFFIEGHKNCGHIHVQFWQLNTLLSLLMQVLTVLFCLFIWTQRDTTELQLCVCFSLWLS